MANWYYLTESKTQEGPVSSQQLRDLAAQGWVSQETLVWKEGLPEWVAASKIKGLFGDAHRGETRVAGGRPPLPPPVTGAPAAPSTPPKKSKKGLSSVPGIVALLLTVAVAACFLAEKILNDARQRSDIGMRSLAP